MNASDVLLGSLWGKGRDGVTAAVTAASDSLRHIILPFFLLVLANPAARGGNLLSRVTRLRE